MLGRLAIADHPLGWCNGKAAFSRLPNPQVISRLVPWQRSMSQPAPIDVGLACCVALPDADVSTATQ